MKNPLELSLGRSFDLIFLKLGTIVISIENWRCIVFEPIDPMRKGAGGQENSNFFEKLNLIIYSADSSSASL